jgi:hypothetical protein
MPRPLDATSIAEPSRSGIAWAPLLVTCPLAWWTISLLAPGSRWIFPDYVNLAFHEAGHLGFRIGGSTLMYLGGTLGQLLVPLLLGARFLLWEREPLGAAACLWWTGENLANVSVYMADARSLALPLVGGGDHDWNELFYRFGLLSEAAVTRISGLTWSAGALVILAGLAWCGYFLLPSAPRLRVKTALTGRAGWMALLLERGR